jgi:hypothetical protein
MRSILRAVKNRIYPPGVRPVAIKSGPFAGVVINFDLAHQTQKYLGIVKKAWWRLLIPERRELALNRWIVAHAPADLFR